MFSLVVFFTVSETLFSKDFQSTSFGVKSGWEKFWIVELANLANEVWFSLEMLEYKLPKFSVVNLWSYNELREEMIGWKIESLFFISALQLNVCNIKLSLLLFFLGAQEY